MRPKMQKSKLEKICEPWEFGGGGSCPQGFLGAASRANCARGGPFPSCKLLLFGLILAIANTLQIKVILELL